MSELPARRPIVAGQFYPSDRAGCIRDIERYLPAGPSPDLPQKIVAGLVPHAGWVFSGAVAARVFAAINTQWVPETFVLVSAMHRWSTSQPAIYAYGRWATPLGVVEVDEELAAAVIEAGDGLLINAPEAHSSEHSIEVQVPFIQHLFPEAKILPIMIPPDKDAARAGAVIGQTVSTVQRPIVVVGTTDLTHYGATHYGFAPEGTGERALEWVRANDERVINLILAMQAEEIVAETNAHHNACGGGAVAGTVAAARALGAEKGYLLEYTTSHHVMPRGPATDFVGYAAVVF
ncbi:MAG: AmmeMemoRadiSam system protein B [Chloroflexota bacterium]|nr:AmmeMemoRadiSam system protein B [Chloroflexota bacterium]